MKNWNTLNINKKTMVENFKISIFEKNINNIHLYTCDFICNNHATLLLENIIEMYIEFYSINNIKINSIINNCINIIKDNNKQIYLIEDKIQFNILANYIIFLNKSASEYYKKHFEVSLLLDSSIILNNLDNNNLDKWNYIKEYIPYNQHKYFIELIYYISANDKTKVFNLLNTIINKFSKKTKLLKNIETINNAFKDHLIILLLELFKLYKNQINNSRLNKYYDMYTNIFYWKLKKGNIHQRSSIIFLLFELILSRNVINKSKMNVIINYDEINDVYSQLITFYELNKVKKTVKKKQNKKTNEQKEINEQNNNEEKEENEVNKMEYLFTMCNFNNKSMRNKSDKVQRNNYRINNLNEISKPIDIDCKKSLFDNDTKNNINIIKNY